MIGQNVVNIPLTAAKDSLEARQELQARLNKCAADVVELVCGLSPAEQQAVLEMAKQVVIANNARLYDLTMKSAESQAQTAFSHLFGGMVGGGGETIRAASKHGASWLKDELQDDEVKP